MPFSPYRSHRFSDPTNRSRFPVSSPLSHMRGMSSSQIPSGWHTPQPRKSAYQIPYTPLPTPQSGFVPQQQYRVTALHTNSGAKSLDMQTPYFETCLTPEDTWNQCKTNLEEQFTQRANSHSSQHYQYRDQVQLSRRSRREL